jgi:hypothetical protein
MDAHVVVVMCHVLMVVVAVEVVVVVAVVAVVVVVMCVCVCVCARARDDHAHTVHTSTDLLPVHLAKLKRALHFFKLSLGAQLSLLRVLDHRLQLAHARLSVFEAPLVLEFRNASVNHALMPLNNLDRPLGFRAQLSDELLQLAVLQFESCSLVFSLFPGVPSTRELLFKLEALLQKVFESCCRTLVLLECNGACVLRSQLVKFASEMRGCVLCLCSHLTLALDVLVSRLVEAVNAQHKLALRVRGFLELHERGTLPPLDCKKPSLQATDLSCVVRVSFCLVAPLDQHVELTLLVLVPQRLHPRLLPCYVGHLLQLLRLGVEPSDLGLEVVCLTLHVCNALMWHACLELVTEICEL